MGRGHHRERVPIADLGPLTAVPELMESSAVTITPFNPQRVGVASLAGRRPANEDAWAAPGAGMNVAPGTLYVVADGVGGQERGEQASQAAVAIVFRVFYERRAAGDDTQAALRAAVGTANAEVNRLAREMGVGQMGCTLVAVAVGHGRLHVAHVGDARAYLWQGGRLRLLTRDHTWVQEQVDRGTITPEDAARHEFRHIVTRVLGNDPTIEVTLDGPVPTGPGDRLLLTSDGVHDVVSEARLAQLLAAGSPVDAARALVAEALDRGSEDNVTALVALVGSGRVAAVPPSGEGRVPAPGQGRVPPAARPATGEGRNYPAGQPRRRSALLPALLLAGLVLVAVVMLFAILARDDENAPAPTLAPTTALPNTADPAPGLLPAPTSTAATIATPPGAGDPVTSYPGTADAAPPREMCITHNDIVYIWTNEQVNDDGSLCESAQSRLQGRRVLLLTAPGQERLMEAESGWFRCDPAWFVQVRSMADSSQEGWILLEHIGECRGDE